MAQTQQRREAIAARLRQHGIDARQLPPPSGEQQQQQQQQGGQQQPAGEPPALNGSSIRASSLTSRQQLLPPDGQQAVARETPGQHASPASPADAGSLPAAAGQRAADEREARFQAWMREVSEGCCRRQLCLTPSRWGARLAPQLPLQRAAEVYTGAGV